MSNEFNVIEAYENDRIVHNESKMMWVGIVLMITVMALALGFFELVSRIL